MLETLETLPTLSTAIHLIVVVPSVVTLKLAVAALTVVAVPLVVGSVPSVVYLIRLTPDAPLSPPVEMSIATGEAVYHGVVRAGGGVALDRARRGVEVALGREARAGAVRAGVVPRRDRPALCGGRAVEGVGVAGVRPAGAERRVGVRGDVGLRVGCAARGDREAAGCAALEEDDRARAGVVRVRRRREGEAGRRARVGRVDEDDGRDARGVADVVGAGQRVGVAEAVGRDGVTDAAGRGHIRSDRRRVAGDRAGRGADACCRRRGLRADERVAAGGPEARRGAGRALREERGDVRRDAERAREAADRDRTACRRRRVVLDREARRRARVACSVGGQRVERRVARRARREGEAVRVERARARSRRTCPRCGSWSSRRRRSSTS